MGSTPSITVFTNATLDVSAVTDLRARMPSPSTANQILAGSGTVTGNVNASRLQRRPSSRAASTSHGTAGGMGVAGTLSYLKQPDHGQHDDQLL